MKKSWEAYHKEQKKRDEFHNKGNYLDTRTDENKQFQYKEFRNKKIDCTTCNKNSS